MCWGKRAAAAALAGLVMYAGAAQAGVVVKASGPSSGQYPVGKKLDDSASVSLKAGDSITVLTANGTKVITGPGNFTVGVRGESKRSTFAVLTRQASGARVRTGAVRSGGSNAAPLNPSLWNMDVTQPGKFCLADASRVTFWRPATAGERVYVLGSGQSDYLVQVKFADGAAQASLAGAQLPLDANRSYRLSSEAGAPPQAVEFVLLETVPETADGLAAVLAEKGCNAQLTMLSDRLMTSGE
jgi:hypothetical protein